MPKLQEESHKDKVPDGKKRSNEWPRVRAEYLKNNPFCAVCGGENHIEVHHVRTFCRHPELELDPDNFITLCEDDKNGVCCHQLFGHIGSFKSFNANVREDTAAWNNKIKNRPKEETPAVVDAVISV